MNSLLDLNPHIRYAKIHKMLRPIQNQIAVCYDCRVFFFNQAGGSVLIGDQKYEISNQTVVYLPAQTKYWFDVSCSEAGWTIVMDFDLVTRHAHLSASLGTATEMDYDPEKAPVYHFVPELAKPIVRTLPQVEGALLQCTDLFLECLPLYREQASAKLKLCSWLRGFPAGVGSRPE